MLMGMARTAIGKLTIVRRDSRSPEALEWRKLYQLRAWRIGRLQFLEQNPLCERCTKEGHVTAATIVNHRKPHKGSLALFLDWANWEAICAPHHDIDVQSEERLGYSKQIGIDGWPTDPRHAANAGHSGGGE